MKRTTHFGMAALLVAGGMAVLPGCQNSGRRDDTSRALNVSGTYDRAYLATRDTEWLSAPGATPQTLSKGTRAYFAEAPGAADVQQAKVEGMGVGYVHPTHFQKETR